MIKILTKAHTTHVTVSKDATGLTPIRTDFIGGGAANGGMSMLYGEPVTLTTAIVRQGIRKISVRLESKDFPFFVTD